MLPLAFMGASALYQTQQTGGPPSDPWSKLATYGPLGIFAAALLWFAWQAYNKVVKDRDDERNYSRGLDEKLREQIMPLLAQVQSATADAVTVITQVRAEMDVRDRMEGAPRRRAAGK